MNILYSYIANICRKIIVKLYSMLRPNEYKKVVDDMQSMMDEKKSVL